MSTECVLAILAISLAGVASAATTVTTHDDDGTILVNGKRTFIIGSYHKAKSDMPYQELADAGYTLVNAGADPKELDAAHAAGLMAWVSVGTLNLADKEKSRTALEQAVRAVKDHPAVAFLETVDEPAWTWMKADLRVPAQALVEAYPIIKAIDPNHLLYTNHAPTNLVKTLQSYNAGTDIVACDIYPVNPGGLKPQYALFEDGYQGDLNNIYISQVGEYTDKMRVVAGPNRPVFMVLQAFAWEMAVDEKDRRPEKILFPTFEQTRFMSFQAIIRGANGVVFWGSYLTPQPSDAWSEHKRAVRQIADLLPILAARVAPQTLTFDYHELGRSVDDGVQWLAKEHEGKLYMLTCNADKNPCRATVSDLHGWTSCSVLQENRTLTVDNGAITDDWKPFDVHIYELSR